MSSVDLQNSLKNSKNIAIIANQKYTEDALCASVALSELIKEFLKREKRNYLVNVFYLDTIPAKCIPLSKKCKIYTKIGEKTLNIRVKVEGNEKLIYDFDEKKKEFVFSLVSIKSPLSKIKKTTKYEISQEMFDFVVGVGFKDEKDIENSVCYTKKIENKYVFNKENMASKDLCDGVFDIFCKENIKPSKLASLSFVTYFS